MIFVVGNTRNTGFVGVNLISFLKEFSYTVIGISRNAAKVIM